MISKDCRMSDFFRAVKDQDYFEVIYLADREATEAERLMLRPAAEEPFKTRCGREYAVLLKQFIFFLRYGLKPSGISPQKFELFQAAATENRFRRGV